MQSEVNPEAARILYNTGNQLKNSGQLDAAAVSYQKALAIKSDCTEALNHLAEVYYIQGKLSEARAHCHRSLKINPHFALPYKTLGDILQAQGKVEAAIRSYSKAIEIQPDFAEAHAEVGSIYYHKNQFKSAILCYKKAIKNNPYLADSHWFLGKAFARIGRVEEALNCQEKALKLNPSLGGSEVYFNRGNTLLEQGNLEEAIDSYKRALELEPNYTLAYINLGIAWRKLGRLEEAVSNYQKAIAIKPDLAAAHCNLANTLFDFGKPEEAVTSYRQAIHFKPDLAEAHFGLGYALAYLNVIEEAIVSYNRALQFRDNYSKAYINLVNCLIQNGELEAAIAGFQTLLELHPQIPHLYFQELGYSEEAIAAGSSYPSLNFTKKLCKSTRYLAATYKPDVNQTKLFYREIHPASQISLSLPKTPDGNIPEKLKHTQGRSPESFVVVVPDGRAWGDRVTSIVITSDNQLLTDVSTGPAQIALIACTEYLPPPHQVNGIVAFLSVLAGADYYHWMGDVLPKIELLRRSGIDLNSIDNFVINDYCSPFQAETLKTLNIPETKILTSKQYPHLKASRLVVPSVPTSQPRWRGQFIDGVPKWVCNFLRREFLNKKYLVNSAKPERIYISRKLAARRRVINEDEVMSWLEKLGFISVTLESMSLAEQISLLATAKVVVAPHGAGLTNLVFSSPGTKVIEIFSRRYVSQCYWVMSNQIGLEYYYLLAETIDDNLSLNLLPPSKNINSAMFEDMFVNLNSLINIIAFAGVA